MEAGNFLLVKVHLMMLMLMLEIKSNERRSGSSEMTLEEKRKALPALKTDKQEKVDVKELESMQQLSNNKAAADVFHPTSN